MTEDETPELFVAATSAVFQHEGASHRIVKGKTTVRRGHKILRGREHMFRPLKIDFDVPQVYASKSRAKKSEAKVES